MFNNFFGYRKSTIRLSFCNRLELKRIFFWFIILFLLFILFILFITAKNAWSGSLDHLDGIQWDHISVVLEEPEFQEIYNKILELAPFLTSEEIRNYTNWFIKYSKEVNLEPILPVYISYWESKFHTEVEYDRGNGAGLMQIIFGSHRGLMSELGIKNRRELFTNPEKNIQAGCRILAMSYYQYNTINLALSSTNHHKYKKSLEQKNQKQFEKDIINKIPKINDDTFDDTFKKFVSLFLDPSDIKEKKIIYLVKNIL